MLEKASTKVFAMFFGVVACAVFVCEVVNAGGCLFTAYFADVVTFLFTNEQEFNCVT